MDSAGFDLVVCAGNVMTFVAPSTRVAVLRGVAGHLADGGRAVVGFGADRGYPFDEFTPDADYLAARTAPAPGRAWPGRARSLALIDTKVTSYEKHLAAGSSGDPWQSAPDV